MRKAWRVCQSHPVYVSLFFYDSDRSGKTARGMGVTDFLLWVKMALIDRSISVSMSRFLRDRLPRITHITCIFGKRDMKDYAP